MKFLSVLGILATCFSTAVVSQTFPRALPDEELPKDVRLGALRTLNDYFPFTKVESPEAWRQRASELRRQVLVATGLWPMPSKLPLQAVVHGRVEREAYTVEKVYFESFPGHYVSGNLYRPRGLVRGHRVPGLLSPHGHWQEGRFHDHGAAELKKQLAEGGEKYESGRHPLQARCVQLARMGCVVFHYDMVGYADSLQLDHRNSLLPNGGLFSVGAELRQQSVMGIQTFNSIRALDFIASLPDVDNDRIGVTGGSGGGTQTFILGAVDDRPAALFPAVMVGTAMQGGCVCENANYLRIGAGNVDLAALSAPRPLGLTGADDWTVEIETKGKPDLERLYNMLAGKDRLQVSPFLKFGHNFNAVSRQAMYQFFNRHFQLGFAEPITEADFKPLSQAEMSVWSSAHPAPKSRGSVHERALLNWWEGDSDTQLAAIAARMADDYGAAQAYKSIVGGAWQTIFGRTLLEAGPIDYEFSDKVTTDRGVGMTGTITAKAHGEQVPCLFLHPGESWNDEVIIWLHSEGKASVLNDDGRPNNAVMTLVENGYSVMAIDVLLTGEFTEDRRPVVEAPSEATKGRAPVSCYLYGYNRPLFVKRVHDVLTAVAFVAYNPDWDAKAIHLAGIDGGGSALALAARSQCGDTIGKTVAHLSGVRLGHAKSLSDPWFVPGSVKYGGLPGLMALSAPAPLLLIGESEKDLNVVQQAYSAHGAEAQFVRHGAADAEGALAWLMK